MTTEAFMEAFGLNVSMKTWFLSLDDAKEKIEAWQVDYNEHRPQSAPGNLAPR
jgi:putative transposase